MTRLPVVALQVLQQRDSFFEPLQILGHGVFSHPESSLGRKAAIFPGEDGGRHSLLNPQGPEPGEKRKSGVPAQWQGIVFQVRTPREPGADGQHRPAHIGKRWVGRIQTPEPSAQCGRIGYTIGVFDYGGRSLPATALDEIAAQRLAAGNQAVSGIRWRERWQQRERLATKGTKATSNRNPIVVFVMSLFPTAAMSDYRIAQAYGAPADDLCADLGPVSIEVVLRRRKWDNENRVHVLCRGG
jgi:hypothetical protein